MKRLSCLVGAIVALCCCKPSGPEYIPRDDKPEHIDWKAAYSWVFDDSVIPQIYLSISTDEWNRLLKAYDRNNKTKEYIKCNATYVKEDVEQTVPEAGLRLRGNTSRRRPEGIGGKMHVSGKTDWHHCHFSLDFHHYQKNVLHTVKGVRQVDLKWFKDDPAYVREIYCYDLFRRFGVWTAVNDIYARLWIKVGDDEEAYYGIYGMLEHIDRNYLMAREKLFGSADGNLWKCSYGANLRKTNADFGEDDNEKEHVYELKSSARGFEAAKEQLQNFIVLLNTQPDESLFPWLESVMDIDLFLRTYAVSVAVGMWDDYWNNSNNYYLYMTPEGRFYFIPFDYDNTLGTSLACGVQNDAGRQSPLKWGDDSNPLVMKILRNPEWKAKYIRYLKELCADEGGLNTAGPAGERIRNWQSRISSYISNDTGEDMQIEDKPASWGNHGEYRIMDPGINNFFQIKGTIIASL